MACLGSDTYFVTIGKANTELAWPGVEAMPTKRNKSEKERFSQVERKGPNVQKEMLGWQKQLIPIIGSKKIHTA